MNRSEAGILGARVRWNGHVKTPDRPLSLTHYNKGPFKARKKHDAVGNLYECQKEQVRKWRQRNPEKRRAHNAVQYALRMGRLAKRPCHCGALNVHAHHHNGYENQLDVMWLCPTHHNAVHSGQEIEVN